MSNVTPFAPSTEPGASPRAVESILRDIALWTATVQAHEGRYSDAEDTLRPLLSEEPLVAAPSHLLARIRAQQGRLGEAEAIWLRIRELDPGHAATRAALERVAALRRKAIGISSTAWVRVAFVLLLAAAVAVGGWIALRWQSEMLARSVQAELAGRGGAGGPEIDGKKAKPRSGIQAGRAGTSDSSSPKSEEHLPPRLDLTIQSLTSTPEGDALVVRFHEGLFRSGSRLTPEGESALAALAHQLEPHAGRVIVQVCGHTDNVPPAPAAGSGGNDRLAMNRALAAVQQMRASAPLPAQMFTVAAWSAWQSPYPDDTAENRGRNRTVVVRIRESNPWKE